MKKAQFGMVGLGVMGRNLALNVERNGFRVAVWNREKEWVQDFLQSKSQGKRITGTRTIEEFVGTLEKPRRIMMMIKAGPPVDWTIDLLRPHLALGDLLIDGGNSYFPDTVRREAALAKEGLKFFGVGVSGGETGALWGPSMMPGGEKEAYQALRPIFEKMAAKTEDGACVAYCGPNGAGHFVKMVHNGIEYGDMELIAEAYQLMKKGLGLSSGEMAQIFSRWNRGLLESFLIEITSKILTVRDERTGHPLVDKVLDKAGQKGTGKWASQVALDLGVAIPTIHASIEARFLSSLKGERVAASRAMKGPAARFQGDKEDFIQCIHDALYASKICSYAQGMALIKAGSDHFKWGIELSEMARIWKAGCIIRARLLQKIQQAYREQADLPNLLMDPHFRNWVLESQPRWRKTVVTGQQMGLPLPAMSASLAYFDTYRTANLPLNLTQAQRDFFGSHTYQRTDDPGGAFIHTDWIGITGEV
ncbi:MAG: NADP-dependent phosphogluconate dehydrogenase [Acidobacteriota bacterium]